MNLKITTLAATGMLVFASAVSAAPVLIVNHSFEAPVQADGAFTVGTATGWTVFGTSGVWNPAIVQIAQGPTDGVQVGYSNNIGLGLQQDLAAVLTAGTQYTLMVDILSRTDGFTHKSSTLELRTAANDLLASASFGPVPAGTNQLLTASFFAGALDPNLGENLRINLFAGGSQSDWDNVRLDASPVPLPATVWLLGAGLMGLGALRRKR